MTNSYRICLGILLLLVTAFLFTAFHLNASRSVGRLSTVSNYDDVVYLNNASVVYFLAQQEGLAAAARHLFTKSLHAPFPVFNALAGFAVFGYSLDRVYYALTLVVFTYLLGVGIFARRLPDSLWIAVVAVALAVPFAAFSAVEFRPDLMWATLIGFAGVAWIGESGVFSKRRYSVLFGLALGFLLFVKPSTFAMTLLVMGGCWFLAAVRALFSREVAVGVIARNLAITLLAAFLVCGWYWVQHGKEIFDYFYANSFGANQDIWAYRGSLVERYAYYFRGVALDSNLGLFWLPLVLIYLAGSVRDLVNGCGMRIRGVSFLWMLLCLVIVNSVFGMKSPFLGGSLYGFVIFGAFFYLPEFLGAFVARFVRPEALRWIVAVVLVVAAWNMQRFPPAGRVHAEAAANQKTANLGALADLQATVAPSQCILFTHGNPIVPEFLEMELRAQGKPVHFQCGSLARTLAELQPSFSESDFVFVQDQQIVGAPGDAIPGEKLQPEIKSYLDANPQWRLLDTYPLSGEKNVYLYQKISLPKP